MLKRIRAACCLQKRARGWPARKSAWCDKEAGIHPEAAEEAEQAAAQRLQRWTRGWLGREKLWCNKFMQMCNILQPMRIQTWWRDILARKSTAAAEERKEELQCMDKYLEQHCGVPKWILKEPKRRKWWQWVRHFNAIRLQRCVRGWLTTKAAVPRKEPGGKLYWGGIVDPKCDGTARVEFAQSDNTASEKGVEERLYCERENRNAEYANGQYAIAQDPVSPAVLNPKSY